jgi:hypothetical protein
MGSGVGKTVADPVEMALGELVVGIGTEALARFTGRLAL